MLLETLTTGKSQRQVRMTKTIVRNGQPEEVVLLVSTERIQLGHTRPRADVPGGHHQECPRR